MANPRTFVMASAVLLAGCLGPTTPSPDDLVGEAKVPWAPLCEISNWIDACTALASPNLSPSKTEIDIAVNPKNPLNVVVASKDNDPLASRCVWGVAQVSKDGGETWKSVYLGGTRAQRWTDPTNPLWPWDCVTDPILAFDANGILYYPLQTYTALSDSSSCLQTRGARPVNNAVPGAVPTGCGYSFYLAVSTDGGDTFPKERIIPMALGDANLLVHDYPRVVVNPKTGTVSTVWNALGGYGADPTGTTSHANAYVVSTRDQGKTVDRPTIVSSPERPKGTPFASGFTATRDGVVYMTVWITPTTDGKRPVFLAVSADDAKTFGGFGKMFDIFPVQCPLPNTKFRCGSRVELAADTSGGAHDGRLYATWMDARNGNSDVFVSWSDDKTAWSEPLRVNTDTGTNAQWMPRLDVGPDGTVHILYLDRSWDPEDRLYDATHASSTDGGATWVDQRITSVSSDGDLGIHQTGAPFIGDYIGVDAVGDHVYLGFPSTATGKTEIAVAHLMRS